MIRYEDAHYYYVWKPHDIPTTYGNEYSFLERIADEEPSFFKRLQEIFNEKQEYGLVNRLDNDTAGLLYFAKTNADYDAYEQAQKTESLYKIYVCDLQGQVMIDKTVEKADPTYVTKAHEEGVDGLCITYPIMHHAHDSARMVGLVSPKDANKGRGTLLEAKTTIFPFYYDAENNITTCYALIHQGTRHQIRVHTSALGYPIIGDILYNKKYIAGQRLHLRSIGLSDTCNFLRDM